MTYPIIGLTTVRSIGEDGRVRDGLTQDYAQAITYAGAVPVLIPLSTLEVEKGDGLLRALYERLDGVVLPGGGDVHPARYGYHLDNTIRGVSEIRDAVEIQLAQWAYADNLPLLGICRGHQTINIALGGTLHPDIRTYQGASATLKHDADAETERAKLMHTVTVSEDSLLARSLEATYVDVNSLHHQAVNQLAAPFIATAWSDDGIIEGIEVPSHRFYLGVQWHPEAIATRPAMSNLFRNFVKACTPVVPSA